MNKQQLFKIMNEYRLHGCKVFEMDGTLRLMNKDGKRVYFGDYTCNKVSIDMYKNKFGKNLNYSFFCGDVAAVTAKVAEFLGLKSINEAK